MAAPLTCLLHLRWSRQAWAELRRRPPRVKAKLVFGLRGRLAALDHNPTQAFQHCAGLSVYLGYLAGDLVGNLRFCCRCLRQPIGNAIGQPGPSSSGDGHRLL